jgi:hypothetical protein
VFNVLLTFTWQMNLLSVLYHELSISFLSVERVSDDGSSFYLFMNMPKSKLVFRIKASPFMNTAATTTKRQNLMTTEKVDEASIIN